jgi:hypothetical protein
MEASGKHHAPTALPPGKDTGTLGGPQNRWGPFREEQNILALIGSEPRNIQSVA